MAFGNMVNNKLDNSMNNDDLFNSLSNLNNARRGSLGEFIFYHESLKQGLKIESLHEQRVDFIINGTI
jgi:hypothetical protein